MSSLSIYSVLGVAAAGFVVCRVIYTWFIWPLLLSPLRALPGPPLGHPILGQIPAVIKSEAGILHREWVKKYGPVVRVVGPIGMERVIFLKPEALQQILVKDWLEYPRPTFMRRLLGLVAGEGLLTTTGNEHRQMRRAINPAFSIPNLMSQAPMYNESIKGLVDIISKEISEEGDPAGGKTIPVYDWMSKVTLDIICEVAFGYRADSLHNPHNPLAEAYERLLSLQSGFNLIKVLTILSLPGGIGSRFLYSDLAYRCRHFLAKLPVISSLSILVESMHHIKAISRQMLADKMKDAEIISNDHETKKDIMSILVRARKAETEGGKEGFSMNDEAMVNQVLTFLGAGHETTASGLTWTLWHLAKNPAFQDRLRAELAPIFAEDSYPDYRVLKEQQWLDSVVMESLRIMPPVPMTVRLATRTGHIDGVVVPKGTYIQIPIRVVNTWKEVWGEDGEEFNPERWLNLPANYHPTFSMLSFIAGPHACIGRTMSIMEMKIVLAHLIVNFHFEPAFPGQVTKPEAAITIKPTDGMPLRVRRVKV